MSLRPIELQLLATEISRELEGAVVQKVYAPSTTRLFLELRVPGRTVLFSVCSDVKLARVSVVVERSPNPSTPPAWQHVLRRDLTGAKLHDAEALVLRRTMLLHFTKASRAMMLAFELGSPPSIFLVNEKAKVIAHSIPGRLRIGEAWAPLGEGEPNVAESRLSGDRPILRLCHAAERLFEKTEYDLRLAERRAPLISKLKRLCRTKEKVETDLARTKDADRFRREAELLRYHVHEISRGMSSVELTEYNADGTIGTLLVKLDPRRTPREEIDWRFHQYRRLQRGATLAQQRLNQLSEEEAALRREIESDDVVPTEASASIIKPGLAKAGKRAPYREFVAHDGQRIWVGRGATHNDTLTFQVASPHHIWLHARGIGGAHVVIPIDKNQELKPEVLLDAAHLALHHSEAKGEPRGEVSYTQVKFVKKNRIGGPGAVTYTREKTIMLRVEPSRLARLAKSEMREG